jgi:signal transduction histidine kinase
MGRYGPGLAGWLAIVTALLVTIAVSAVSIAGARLLRNLADTEALTRVELAISSARDAIRQSTDDLHTAARVLGERPTLRQYLRSPRSEAEALRSYLARYCEGASLDGCAIVQGGRLLAAVGEGLRWPPILAEAEDQGDRFLLSGASDVPVNGAKSAATGHDGVDVLVVRRMNGQFAERLSERVGLEIRIIDFAAFEPGEGPLAVLNSDALARDAPIAGRVAALDAYVGSVPVAGSTGETVALLQGSLPTDEVMGPVSLLQQRMLLTAVAVALLATTGGILVGRYWINGVQRLTQAARRIGSGDLAASIPGERSAELGVLASTMEEMRRNLIELTEEIRRREAQAQAVLGGIVEGVYAVDQKRRIRFLNSQGEKLLNTSAEEAFGRFCGDVLRPERDNEGRRPCETSCPIVAARQAGAAEAVERIHPDIGSARRVVITSAQANDGIQVQVLRDETDLEAVRRTRDTVLANISHEFRTPLAAQLASIELLDDGLGSMSTEAQRDLVSSLQRGVRRLTWLIDNLLESVRIESGQLTVRRHEVVIGDVIESARELIEPLIRQRAQRLEVQRLESLPAIRGDRERLIQVLVNLLANASKFAPPGSIIRVGGREANAADVILWVEDEGRGPADFHDSMLFERFHRSGGEDPEESGLGLGLFIVNSIVQRHGGRVKLTRTAEQRTRAEVQLPTGIRDENTDC